MIVYRTKYYGIHTDRVRALAEQIGRGKNLKEKKLADWILGKSKEGKNSREIHDKITNLLDKRGDKQYFDYDIKRDKINNRQREFLRNYVPGDFDYNLLSKYGHDGCRFEWWKQSSNLRDGRDYEHNWRFLPDPKTEKAKLDNEKLYDDIANKIVKDYIKDSIKQSKANRRSIGEWLKDRKVNKEIIDYVNKNYPEIKGIEKDSIISVAIANSQMMKFGDIPTGESYFSPLSKKAHLGIGEHNKPNVTGHEVNHGLFQHEVDSKRTDNIMNIFDDIDGDREQLKKRVKDLIQDPDKIHDFIHLVNHEHNTADRGAVILPYLGSKSATSKELNRYAKDTTSYNKILQGYIPPSLDYHTDPATIKKIKEHVEEQQAIEKYLNTDRKWL